MLNKWKIENFSFFLKALHSLRLFEMVFRYFHVMNLITRIDTSNQTGDNYGLLLKWRNDKKRMLDHSYR